jgi:hypothetical protein
MFRSTATDLSTKPTSTRQGLRFAPKNTRFEADGCICLSDKDNNLMAMLESGFEVGSRSLNCSKLPKYKFCRTLLCFFLISNFIQTLLDGQWHCKDALPTRGCLTTSLCLGPSYQLTMFGRGLSEHSVYTGCYAYGRLYKGRGSLENVNTRCGMFCVL